MTTTYTDFKPALIIVDVQEDFCPPNGSLAVPNGRDIIPTINTLLTYPFALKIATKDWHPADHISFSSQHPSTQPFTSFTTITHPFDASKTYETRLWPDHCVQNTPGAELLLELDASRVQRVIEKGKSRETEMYSAFRDPFGWQVSELQELLEGEGVTDVFVTGLAGDYCVRDTAVDATKGGWKGKVWVVDEGVRCVDPGAWEGVKGTLEAEGVKVVRVDGVEVEKVRGLDLR